MAKSSVISPLPSTLLLSEFPSDDEESFVVLGTSLPPSPDCDDICLSEEMKAGQAIDGSIVEEALNLIQGHISELSNSTASLPSMPKVAAEEMTSSTLPSMPKVSEQDMASLAGRFYISTITTNSSVDLSPDEIQQKVDLLVEENIKLKETLRQNNLAMKNQYETLVLWQEDVMKVHQSHKEKFVETKKYIENLKIENARLTQALELEQSKSSNLKEIEATKFTNTNLTEFELEAAYKRISVLEAELKQLKIEKSNWEKTSQQQSLMNSQKEDLQKQLEQSKISHSEEITDYIKKLQQSDSLQKILLEEIKVLKTKFSDHSNCITQEMLNQVQEQLMTAQMHITNLELQKNEDKENINTKELQITKLETKLHEDEERMNALVTQLDLYKTDFETERTLRTTLTAEKEQIANDLQQLQRRNNQLLEEIEHWRPSGFSMIGASDNFAVSSNTPSAPQSSPQLSSPYHCPLCMSRFRSLHLLEDHVDYCLSNHS